MISLEEAQSYVLSHCQPLLPVDVPLDQALGCVTSVAIFADQSVPPFANSAMDGFAVRAADTADAPVTLKVTGTTAAGQAPAAKVGEGEAVRIMTGAAMPPGADAVVMVELTEAGDGDDTIVIQKAAEPGQFVRAAGSDLESGQMVFPAGTELRSAHLGILAAIGMDEVPTFPRPRVGVLSTGDELVDGGEPLAPGQIRDANRHTLLALCRDYGLEAIDLGIVPDDPARIKSRLEDAVSRCDVVLTSGGVSVGDFDHVKGVLEELAEGAFRAMEVAIKPAKPLAFGVANGRPVFALPGNPVSSMVSFELFAYPALRQMTGHQFVHRRKVKAMVDEPLERKPDGKLHLVHVTASYEDDGGFHVASMGSQDSHLLRTMALADALALVPDGDGIPAGQPVDILLLSYR